MTCTRPPVAILLVLSVIAACAPDRPGEADISATVTDSAGVRIVEIDARLSAVARSTVGVERIAEVGTEGSGLELFRVTSARFLASGELAIGNAGASEVVVVDDQGGLVRRIGRRGEGPGEFGTVTSLHLEGDGGLLVYDDPQARLSLFDASGELVDTRRLTDASPIADLFPLTASFDGPVLAVYADDRRFGRDGEIRRDTTPLLRFVPGSMEPDTSGHWAGRIWHFSSVGRGTTRMSLAYGPDLVRAGRGERAALAESHVPEVVVYSHRGEVRQIVRWSESPRPVSDADYATWQAEQRERFGEDAPDGVLEALVSTPSFEAHPILSGLGIGATGELWLAPSELRDPERQTWLRFGPLGEALPSVELPRDGELLDVSQRRLALLRRDPLGVETVELYGYEPVS